MIGTLTDLQIRDSEGITATGSLTGRVTGAITIGTWTAIKPGVAAAAKHSQLHRTLVPDRLRRRFKIVMRSCGAAKKLLSIA
jgi:hypothetical protein